MGTQRKSGRGGGASVALERNESEVQEILDRLAEAVTEGDGRAVARLWAVPALVLGDTMARPVSDLKEVEQFFGGAKEQYNARGIADTRAEIAELQWPTPRIAIAEVRWPWLDAAGIEKGDEVSTYVFRRDDAGKLKIQAVIMHGATSDM
jgi:ketosteroid isomerase-like protein